MSGSSEYTFGHSERAAQRLELVAHVFDGLSEAFLRADGVHGAELAVDLGCGPGYTTELLIDALEPQRTLAVEVSPEFAALAAQRLEGRARVLVADVRDLPPQIAGASVIHARLLLTHLSDPLAAVADWRTRLAADGVLLLEEVDSITTDDPLLADYLELQRTMLSANAHELDIGPRLHAQLGGLAGVRSARASTSPALADAARMFALNFAGWRERPEVTAARSADELDAIAAGLAARADGRAGTGDAMIIWQMRQLVLGPA